MNIIINGETTELSGIMSIAALLTQLQLDARKLAIEHNRVIVAKNNYAHMMLAEGDAIEIVAFIGGG